MRILVTGVGGFIGSHISKKLIELGHEVYGIDNLKSGCIENVPQQMLDEARFANIELVDGNEAKIAFEWSKPEIVHHLACYPYEGLSQFAPRKVSDSVYTASLNVFINAVNYNVKRVVYYSSMARYGDGLPPFSENHIRRPCDIYGASKVAAEVALEALSQACGLEYNILVPHNVSGPRMRLNDPYRGVLAIWVNCIMNSKPFYIYGDGLQERAFSHVDDIVMPCINAGFYEHIKNEIINIGSANVVTLKEAAKILINEVDYGIDPIYAPDRPCEVKRAYCTVDKSMKLLGFEDKKSLKQIFRDILDDAQRRGPQQFKYEELEITKGAPKVWLNKQI